MVSNQLNPDQTARRRKIIGTGLVAVLAAVLIAIVVVRSNGEKLLNENGDTLVLVDKKTGDGMDALGSGVLTDVGGCLGWADEDGGTVVIWPHGTIVVTPEPLRVKIDGKTYRLGDTVKIGGGFVDSLEKSGYFYDRVPETCRASGVFVASAD